jgi:chemotaxis protein MotB
MNRIIAVILAAGLMTSCGHSEEEWQGKLNEISDLNSKIAELEELDKANQVRLTELEDENAKLKAAIGTLQGEKFDLEKLVAKLEEAEEQAKKRLETFENMLKQFQALIDAGKLKVKIKNGKMVLELPSAILFASGSAKLSNTGQETLAEVAAVLVTIPGREFQVSGHTDNVPIKGGKFKNNWILSAARAVSVVEYLQEEGVDPVNLSAAGYSEYQPESDNSDEDGKAQNRRIEIVLMPNLSELPNMSALENMLDK